MDIAAFLDAYGRPVLAAIVGMILVGLILRLRPRQKHAPDAVRHRGPGPGAALARALAGELDQAREILEAAVRAGGPGRADAMVGLVAVLRARGEADLAQALVEALAMRQSDPTTLALQIRVALDAGHPRRAVAVVLANSEKSGSSDLPLNLEIAAHCRADAFDEALSRYEERVAKKDRAPGIVGALLAGCAAQYARAGNIRAARRAIKRSLVADPGGLIGLIVGACLHPREGDRSRLAEAAVKRAPWLRDLSAAFTDVERADETQEGPGAIVGSTEADLDAGEVESALGRLRDHLDEHPTDWRARRRYDTWLLEHGEPSDWRMELADILGHLPTDPLPKAWVPTCDVCGFVGEAAFFVCPRCDRIGTLVEGGAAEVARLRFVAPSTRGAEIADLLHSLGSTGESP